MRRSSDMLVRGGDVVQPDGVRRADVRVRGGRIAAVAPALAPEDSERVIDADGLLVLPGIIDCHTHFSLDTGKMATRDDFVAGSASAAAGGVTTVMNFAPQHKRQSLLEALAAERAKADGCTLVDYGLHLCVGEPAPGWETELDAVAAAGVTSFKVHSTYRDTVFFTRDWDWYRLAQECARRNLLLMIHCENDDVLAGATEALLAAGRRSFAAHAASRPAIAEVETVGRAIAFAQDTGCPTYLVHLSVPASVELARRARARDLPVFAETCAHHLTLEDSVYRGDAARRFVMTPPLRAEAQRAELVRGVVGGDVHACSSDHCGYSLDQRGADSDFTVASPGIPGVETLLPVVFTELSRHGMEVEAIIDLMTRRPAAIFGLRGKGELRAGLDGDLVLFDRFAHGRLDETVLHSRAGYSPWHGAEITGRVVATVARGVEIYRDGEVVAEPGRGRFIGCDRFDRDRIERALEPARAEMTQ